MAVPLPPVREVLRVSAHGIPHPQDLALSGWRTRPNYARSGHSCLALTTKSLILLNEPPRFITNALIC